MKRKIFCSFYCVSNIFSADEEYITFTEPYKVEIYIADDFKTYGSPKNFSLLKKDIENEEFPNIKNWKNFDKFLYKEVAEGKNGWVPSNTFDCDLGKLIEDKYIIKYFFMYDKEGKLCDEKSLDHIKLTLYKKIKFNNDSNLILNGTIFNLKDIIIGNDILNLNLTNEENNLKAFMNILDYFKYQIEDISDDLHKESFYIESYKIENEESCTMKEGGKFSDYIADYINSVRDCKKTELVINSFANYEYSEIDLNEDLDKKYEIDKNSKKYEEFKENVENFIEKFIEDLNKKKDKKLLSDEELTKSIQKELGNDIIIKSEVDSVYNKKSVNIIINDVNNYKDFINPKKIHLSFEAPDGYVFEDTFNSEVDIDFSKRDDINEETSLYDCVKKISSIDLKTIENEIKYKELNDDDSKLGEYKYTNIFYDSYYKIRFKKPINGITKEFDKNNLLINIKFNIDDNIKANYELDGNFNNIISPNNKIKIGKKISDLKTYIDDNLGKNITNYELKENDTVVTDDNKVLTNGVTYIFTFKEGSNCIKEKPKKTDPKKTEPTENPTEENDTNNNINNNKGKCLCSGKNNKTNKKGCC